MGRFGWAILVVALVAVVLAALQVVGEGLLQRLSRTRAAPAEGRTSSTPFTPLGVAAYLALWHIPLVYAVVFALVGEALVSSEVDALLAVLAAALSSAAIAMACTRSTTLRDLFVRDVRHMPRVRRNVLFVLIVYMLVGVVGLILCGVYVALAPR
jgi:hypothetical protein